MNGSWRHISANWQRLAFQPSHVSHCVMPVLQDKAWPMTPSGRLPVSTLVQLIAPVHLSSSVL